MDLNTSDSRGQQSLSSPDKVISPFTTPGDTSDRNFLPSTSSGCNPKLLYFTPVPVIRHTDAVAKRKLTFCVPSVNCDLTLQSNVEESSTVHLGSVTNRPLRGRPSAKDIKELHRLRAVSKFKCTECPMGFQRKKSLATHMLTHCAEKRHDCSYPECGKRFTQFSHLTTHWRVHTREKPFVCTAQNCNSRSTFKRGKCVYHPGKNLIRQDETPEKIVERLSSNQENMSETEVTWVMEHITKKQIGTATTPQEDPLDVLIGARYLMFYINNCHAKVQNEKLGMVR
ncbi:hypothetical protein JTE90_014520 [Oedothorax gibbosus]|uniref:C2H2-type domain-containing protein n=1 Tax=Oedothorax gibbosus TaxID=931172 RepID=A0AAV6VM20_9ARAC|nr:hypothetical protein JTE90_014520 [Oedothorax gibbosus]